MVILPSVVISLKRIATKQIRIGNKETVSIPLAKPGVVKFIQGTGEGGMKYSDFCAGPDGLLYCPPFKTSSVLVIDPCARTLSFIEGAGEGGLKYFGICAGPDGML